MGGKKENSRMSKIFVVGPCGYIGSNLVRTLRLAEREVITIGREDDLSIIQKASPDDVVINAAGYGMKKTDTGADGFLSENVLLPWKIAQYTSFAGIKMIHLSSYFTFFQKSIYAKSKGFCDSLLKHRRNVTIVYLYNVYGDKEYPHRFYSAIKHAILTDTEFVLTTSGACRSLVHLKHNIKAIAEIVDKPINTYHITDGKYLTMSAIVQDIKTIYPNFKCIMRDTPPYTHDCFSPTNPYFEKLDLMKDIFEDVEASR